MNNFEEHGQDFGGDSDSDSSDYEFVGYDENDESAEIENDYKSSFSRVLTRTLYPIDRLHETEDSSIELTSLIDLCCKEVTKDANCLKNVFAFLPINRIDLLMKSAISNEFIDSAAILMSNWPSKSISTSVIDSDRVLFLAVNNDNLKSILAKKITLLWKLFLRGVENNSMLHLRVLDLRGVPMTDAMVYFLLRRIKSLSASNKSRQDDYHIIIDCKIESDETFQKLTSFLSIANLLKDNCKIHLHINTIDVTELDNTECWALFQLIDPKDLVGLRIKSGLSDDIYKFVFTKFSLLKNLYMPTFITSESEILSIELLTNLRRFGFKFGMNFSSKMPISVLRQLEYLEIGRCFDVTKILKHLLSTPLVLRELCIKGHSMVEDELNLWRNLLRSVAPTLTSLELKDCLKNSDLFPSLVNFILPLVNLQFLSLNEKKVSIRMMSDYVSVFCSMPNIKNCSWVCDLGDCSKVKLIDGLVKDLQNAVNLAVADNKAVSVKVGSVIVVVE